MFMLQFDNYESRMVAHYPGYLIRTLNEGFEGLHENLNLFFFFIWVAGSSTHNKSCNVSVLYAHIKQYCDQNIL